MKKFFALALLITASLALATGARMMNRSQAGDIFAGNLHNSVATLLGISSDTLRDLRQEGQSLADIAEAQGVDVETLSAQLSQARQSMIEEAVAEGTFTEAQAEAMLANSQARITAMLEDVNPDCGTPGARAEQGGRFEQQGPGHRHEMMTRRQGQFRR